ncbi:angiopoietin-related protein 4-like [Watersipora subatra]|uniref:angiopoietin-related protein 4-like n=1 Tax=Watersipora subatra TaxID=2589382 RepID=UPI00355C8812
MTARTIMTFPFHFAVSYRVHSKMLDSLAESLTIQTTAGSETTLPSSSQSLTTEEVTSTKPTSEHISTDEPTDDQSVSSEMPTPQVSDVVHSKLMDSLAESLRVQTTAGNYTTLPSSSQSQAAEKAALTQPTSPHLTTDEPTNDQSVTSEMPPPKDCQELYDQGTRCSGVYHVNPLYTEVEPFPVWCDFIDGRGWTVLQRRLNGSVDFLRNWTEYQTGFGNIDGEHWLEK